MLERDPRQDGVLECDARAPGLPGLATLGAVVIARDTGRFQLHDEVVLADLRVVVVHEVALIACSQFFPEPDRLGAVVVELPGLQDIVPVVLLEHGHLVLREHGAHGEREVGDVVRSHVELQHFEPGAACPVVEVVDQEQVELVCQAVSRFDHVHPAVVILRLDDRLRLVVQGLGRGLTHATQGVQDRVIEADAVEPDHPGTEGLEPVDPLNDGTGVVAPVADLKGPLDGQVRVGRVEREDVHIRLDVPDDVVGHSLLSQMVSPATG